MMLPSAAERSRSRTKMRCRNSGRTWNDATLKNCSFKYRKVDKLHSCDHSLPILMGSSIRSDDSTSVKPVLFENMKCEKFTVTQHHANIESDSTDKWDCNHEISKRAKGGNKSCINGGQKGRSRQHSEPSKHIVSGSHSNVSYQRRWSSSSSFYMWKKKSTLKESSPPISNLSPVPIPLKGTATENNINKREGNPRRTVHEQSVVDGGDNYYDQQPCLHAVTTFSSDGSDNYSTPFPLLQLPNELIFMILSNLGTRDLKTCKVVCKQLYNIVSEAIRGLGVALTGNITYHTLMNCCQSHPSSLTFRKCWLDLKLSIMDIVTMIDAIGDQLKKLTIGTSNFSSIAGTDTILHLFASYCQNITFLKLEWITVSGVALKNAIKKLKQLQALDLIDVNGISSHDWLGVLKPLHHQDCNLHSLCVKLQPELPLPMVLSKTFPIYSLKSIACRQRMTKVTKGCLMSLLSGCPNIKEVDIDCIEVSNEARDLLAKSVLKHNFKNVSNR